MSLDQVTSKVSSNSKICELIKVSSLGKFSLAALGRRSVQVGNMSQGLAAKATWPLDRFAPVFQGGGESPREPGVRAALSEPPGQISAQPDKAPPGPPIL